MVDAPTISITLDAFSSLAFTDWQDGQRHSLIDKSNSIRCSEEEYETLVEYCLETNRTQNDVLREFIRKLKKSRPRKTGL